MNAVFSILLLAAILGFIVFLLSKKDQNRRSQYGPSDSGDIPRRRIIME